MKYLVTGAAGFIGAAASHKLLDEGHTVVGLDCINDYYDPALKLDRLATLGIDRDQALQWGHTCRSQSHPRFSFIRINLEDEQAIHSLFAAEQPDIVINLAAQAGVRYSIENPRAYIRSNIDGFINILEECRHTPSVRHLVYASSSSVYGLNGHVPFSEHHGIAHPVSLYAATKKSNELMAHAYSQLYGLPTTSLRFFTVYGPWGRPDMSPFLFMDAMLHGRPIKVFNGGDMLRDFTYIDDIVEGLVRISRVIPQGDPQWDNLTADPAASPAPYRIYNIGNSEPVRLMDYISCIERAAGVQAEKTMLPMQPGDVYQTYADSSALAQATGFHPATPLQTGIDRTVRWFREYFGL